MIYTSLLVLDAAQTGPENAKKFQLPASMLFNLPVTTLKLVLSQHSSVAHNVNTNICTRYIDMPGRLSWGGFKYMYLFVRQLLSCDCRTYSSYFLRTEGRIPVVHLCWLPLESWWCYLQLQLEKKSYRSG